jgi:hypothetical protein
LTAIAVLSSALTLPLASTAPACDAAGCTEGKECAAQAQESQAPQAARSGMRVSIDPATGQFTDSPAAPEEEAAAMTAPSIAPKQEALQGGGFKLDTRGIRHTFVAEANPGGVPKTRCIDEHDAETPHN